MELNDNKRLLGLRKPQFLCHKELGGGRDWRLLVEHLGSFLIAGELTDKEDVVARNEKVVRRFIDAWAALDVEAAMACLAPNIVYVNQPLDPVAGLANVRKIIQGILDQPRRSNGNCLTCLEAGTRFVPSGWTVGF